MLKPSPAQACIARHAAFGRCLRPTGTHTPANSLYSIRITRLQTSRRAYSANTAGGVSEAQFSGGNSNSKIRVSAIFGALLCIGIGATAFGLYDIYSTLTMWPEPVRQDLRAALTAKHQGYLETSIRYYLRALQTGQTLPLDAWGKEPYLKLTSISIALAEIQEEHQLPAQAYETYKDALEALEAAESQLSGAERLRGVALGMKLGEMAEIYQQSDEEEERWLTLAVNWVLKIAQQQNHMQSLTGAKEKAASVDIADLNLPEWITVSDINAPLQALGSFYSRTGKIDYAMPLYLHAISALIPTSAQKNQVSPENMCKGAQLMSSLSELIIREKTTPERLHQAESWAKQSVGILEKVKAEGDSMSLCEESLIFALFNLASILEMKGELAQAQQLFKKSLLQSKGLNHKDGISEATLALRRVDRVQRASTRPKILPDA